MKAAPFLAIEREPARLQGTVAPFRPPFGDNSAWGRGLAPVAVGIEGGLSKIAIRASLGVLPSQDCQKTIAKPLGACLKFFAPHGFGAVADFFLN